MAREQADFVLDEGGAHGRTLRFTGPLSIAGIDNLPARLAQVTDVRTVDLGGVGHLDTVGAWLAYRFARDQGARLVNVGRDAAILIDAVKGADAREAITRPSHPSLVTLVGELGEAVRLGIAGTVGLIGFFGAIVRASGSMLIHRRVRLAAFMTQFEAVGVRALLIIGLMSFLIGIVVAQQGAVQLEQFGADIYTVNLIGRLTMRELGVLMTAIMVAGRSGSAFAAQLGTMKLTEEIDAMRTIGVSPIEALVVPRVVATVLMMILLGFYASLIAIVGGGLLSWADLGIPPVTYVQRIREVIPITDFYVGLIKAPVFGGIVAMAGCYQGLLVEANAEEVGLRTTAAVVQAIFLVITLDAFFAVYFTWIGWD